MKRTLAIIAASALTLSAAISLTGCGGAQSSASEAQATTAAATQAQTEATTAAAKEASSGSVSAEDLIFSYNGAQVSLNQSMDEVISALGEAKDVSSQLSCHGEGEDKTYTYDGFSVNTYPLEGKDHVLEVVVTKEGIPTAKGVQVGDTAAKVKETYGDSYKEVGIYYAYEAEGGKSLQFMIEDDKVKEIDWYYDV